MSEVVRIRRDTYVDSVLLMSASRAMRASGGVSWAGALMGTEVNLADLRAQGFVAESLGEVGANDLVLAVRADSPEAAEAALDAGEGALAGRATGRAGDAGAERPQDLEGALEALPGANVALISVPGDYASLEAHKALSRGLHVLLFSDNVPLEAEVELKRRAAELGLLVMGPEAGTAMLAGVGLGFANAVRRGSVGVVAAAGTGAQEVMSLLHRWGAGPREVIGVGGRDLSAEVGGDTTRRALRALEEDPETEALLLVSKPPAPDVAASVLGGLGGKPAVAALLGLRGEAPAPPGVAVTRTLEEAVLDTLGALGADRPDPSEGLAAVVEEAVRGMEPGRRLVHGLFSGGTLCYESMVVMSERLGPIHSNVPLREGWGLPAPEGSHVCLDLGEAEYTRGRPHPMIDPEPRAERVVEEAGNPALAALLLDVVLGHGSHPDPAAVLAPACAEAVGAGAAVVAYVLGTEDDPQGLDDQRRRLEEAGCLIAPTAARAALMAAAVAARRPEMVKEAP